MTETTQTTLMDTKIIERLTKHFPSAFEEIKQLKPKVTYAKLSDRKYILNVCKYLKKNLNFDYPLSITAMDWPDNFEVVYHIVSFKSNDLIEIHVPISKDDPVIMSVVRVWKGANCHEREAYDMMGIIFKTHPDLRRILLPEEVDENEFPLRKDFPLSGDKVLDDEIQEKLIK